MRKLFLVLIIALIAAPLALATTADKMNFYGRVCVRTTIVDQDKEYTATGVDDTDTNWSLDASRIGFDFTVSDALSAKVEMNASGGNVKYRHWYGAWKFNDNGTFVVGHTWAPTFVALTSSNIGSGDYGEMMGSLRESGLQLWYNLGGGQLKVAALAPSVTQAYSIDTSTLGTTAYAWNDTDTTLPKLEVSYNHKFSIVDMTFFGGYNSTDAEDTYVSGTSSVSIDSYVLGLTAAVDFKPAYFKAGVFMGQNLSQYGYFGIAAVAQPVVGINTATGTSFSYSTYDVDYFGWTLVAGFVVNDRFEVEGSWTHAESELDVNYLGAGGTRNLEADQFSFLATYKLADGVYIYPEIVFHDQGDDEITMIGGSTTTTERGGYNEYGIYWRINF
ncbi:MAG: hypothetical protein EHM45_18410 [Desulfobacteraceae bacterium]|nr:MAG: hypothetical protein EHM45_18410 [Desulfobacteraceae bacterium]